jgi:hypothetical protein
VASFFVCRLRLHAGEVEWRKLIKKGRNDVICRLGTNKKKLQEMTNDRKAKRIGKGRRFLILLEDDFISIQTVPFEMSGLRRKEGRKRVINLFMSRDSCFHVASRPQIKDY